MNGWLRVKVDGVKGRIAVLIAVLTGAAFALGFLFFRQIIAAVVLAAIVFVASMAFLGYLDGKEDGEREEKHRAASGAARTSVPEALTGTWRSADSDGDAGSLQMTIKPGAKGRAVAQILEWDKRAAHGCLSTGTLIEAFDSRIVVEAKEDAGLDGRCRPHAPRYTFTLDRKQSTLTVDEFGRDQGTLRPAKAAPSLAASSVAGKWRGRYTCGQGETGMTLTITPTGKNTVKAIKDFYPLPSNPDVPRGRSVHIGIVYQGQLLLLPHHWEDRPTGYRMVAMHGKVAGTGRSSIKGEGLSRSCGPFIVTR